LPVESVAADAPAQVRAAVLLRKQRLEGLVPRAGAPRILTALLRVVAEPRRYRQPRSEAEASAEARRRWNAEERVHVFPANDAMVVVLHWMSGHRLGHRRILVTRLTVTEFPAGVRRLFTANPADFRVSGVFELLLP
jgi:hypothetical protein